MKLPIKNAPLEIAEGRLLMLVCARQALAAGMTILGLKPLENM